MKLFNKNTEAFANIIFLCNDEVISPLKNYIDLTKNRFFFKSEWVDNATLIGFSENSKFAYARELKKNFQDNKIKMLSAFVQVNVEEDSVTVFYSTAFGKETDRFCKELRSVYLNEKAQKTAAKCIASIIDNINQ